MKKLSTLMVISFLLVGCGNEEIKHELGENCDPENGITCVEGLSCLNKVCAKECQKGWAGLSCDSCAPGYFGENCKACPECGRYGKCDDGINGDGTCHCQIGWEGEACDKEVKCATGFAGLYCDECAKGRFGKDCQPCPDCGSHGQCNDGINGNGQCRCLGNWAGEACNTCKDGVEGDNCDICKNGKLGPNCDECPNSLMTGDNCDVCKNGKKGENCDVCPNELKTGAFCDVCKNGKLGENCDICKNMSMTGENCDVCKNGKLGPKCDECPNGKGGDNCEVCINGKKGDNCDICQNELMTGDNCDVCKNGKKGDNCDICQNELMTGENCDVCKNGRTGENCDACPEGKKGDNCELDIICTDGIKKCDGNNNLMTCVDDVRWDKTPCGDDICQNDACVPHVCDEGKVKCEGASDIMKCEGNNWKLLKTCSGSDEKCYTKDGVTADCYYKIDTTCNADICENDKYLSCVSGAGFKTADICGSGENSNNPVCLVGGSAHCYFSDESCLGDQLSCDGTGKTVLKCLEGHWLYGQSCEEETPYCYHGGCIANEPECEPEEQRCNDNNGEVCKNGAWVGPDDSKCQIGVRECVVNQNVADCVEPAIKAPQCCTQYLGNGNAYGQIKYAEGESAADYEGRIVCGDASTPVLNWSKISVGAMSDEPGKEYEFISPLPAGINEGDYCLYQFRNKNTQNWFFCAPGDQNFQTPTLVSADLYLDNTHVWVYQP